MKNGTCPKCSSTEIMTNVKVRDVGNGGPYPLRVEIEEPEPARHSLLWTPQSATGDIGAWICSQCGYTELYTSNLEELHIYLQIKSLINTSDRALVIATSPEQNFP